MVLLVLNQTKCGLCDQIIHEDDEHIGFTAFIPEGHPLWRYSDSAFHIDCFNNWNQRAEFEELYARYKEHWQSKPSIPDGMTFEEFEKTDQFRKFVEEMKNLFK